MLGRQPDVAAALRDGVDHGERAGKLVVVPFDRAGVGFERYELLVEQDARAAAPLPVRETHALIQQAAPRRDAKRIAFPYDKSHAALVQADDRRGRARRKTLNERSVVRVGAPVVQMGERGVRVAGVKIDKRVVAAPVHAFGLHARRVEMVRNDVSRHIVAGEHEPAIVSLVSRRRLQLALPGRGSFADVTTGRMTGGACAVADFRKIAVDVVEGEEKLASDSIRGEFACLREPVDGVSSDSDDARRLFGGKALLVHHG